MASLICSQGASELEAQDIVEEVNVAGNTVHHVLIEATVATDDILRNTDDTIKDSAQCKINDKVSVDTMNDEVNNDTVADCPNPGQNEETENTLMKSDINIVSDTGVFKDDLKSSEMKENVERSGSSNNKVSEELFKFMKRLAADAKFEENNNSKSSLSSYSQLLVCTNCEQFEGIVQKTAEMWEANENEKKDLINELEELRKVYEENQKEITCQAVELKNIIKDKENKLEEMKTLLKESNKHQSKLKEKSEVERTEAMRKLEDAEKLLKEKERQMLELQEMIKVNESKVKHEAAEKLQDEKKKEPRPADR